MRFSVTLASLQSQVTLADEDAPSIATTPLPHFHHLLPHPTLSPHLIQDNLDTAQVMSLRIATRSMRFVAVPKRCFTVSVCNMAEGATGSGASRPGGVAQGDAFSKKEKAEEDRYMREQEAQR